jgi:hypothetical protein
MSFDTKQPIDTTDTVQFNYFPTTFYKNQYQNTIESSGFIKIPYTSRSNEANIAVLGSGYVTTNLYIVQPIHLIENISYDAELIIEHRSLTNYNDPVYTCFLLQHSSWQLPTSIDNLIEGVEDTVLDLNSYISSQKTIVFRNQMLKTSLIIIFTRPIKIHTALSNLKPGLPFILPYVNEYSIFHTNSILGEVVVEGFDTNTSDLDILNELDDYDMNKLDVPDVNKNLNNSEETEFDYGSIQKSSGGNNVSVAGYCQPIDETDPTIAETANVVLPLNNQFTSTNAAYSTIRTMLNFFGFFVLVIAAIFVTPVAHRIMIVELVLDNDNFTAQRKLNRANAADVYTGALLFGFAIAFINYGIINNKPFATILGFYVFIFFMASTIVLQYERMFSPASYLKQFQTKGVLPSFENMEMDWGFFTDNVSMLFFNKTMVTNPDPATKEKEPMKPSYTFQFGFLIMLGVYFGLYFLLKKLHITGKGGKFFLTSIYFYMLLFSIYLVALFNHYRYVNSKLNKM